MEPGNNFDILSFERTLVELVEEMRVKREIEKDNEKRLRDLMDEKYKIEMDWDERQRDHAREKVHVEHEIQLLKRKLGDKSCLTDDDNFKQQIVNNTYCQEIRALKEELSNCNAEKHVQIKRVQELEGQIKHHNTFQEALVGKMTEIRKKCSLLGEESEALKRAQESVQENVLSTQAALCRFDLLNQHLQEAASMEKKKNQDLQEKLINARSEIVFLRNKTAGEVKKAENYAEKIALDRASELENVLRRERKEHKMTIQNLKDNSNLLCKFIEKLAKADSTVKNLEEKIESYRQRELTWMQDQAELNRLKEKEQLHKPTPVLGLKAIRRRAPQYRPTRSSVR